MQVNYGEHEIKSVLQKVKIFNNGIGTYQLFVIDGNFDYAVKLSNGKITIKMEDIQDDEREALTPERLTAIANGFVSSNPETKTQAQEPVSKPVNTNQAPVQSEKKKGKVLMWILISIGALALLIVGGVFIKNQNNSYSPPSNYNGSPSVNSGNTYTAPPREKTPEELRQELLEKERQNPMSYLTVSYKLDVKVRLLRASEDVINGTIYNSATMATFKDVVVNIKFLTNTDALLATKQYTLYEFVTPNGSKNFQLKVVSPSGTKKIGVEVNSASAE